MTESNNNTQNISYQIPGCGCLTLALAIVGFLYLVGALS